MNWFLIVNDAHCKKDLQVFLQKHEKDVVFKTGIENGLKNIDSPNSNGYLVINSTSHMHLLKIDDIMHCQSNQSYTQFYLHDGKKITATKTLKQFELLFKSKAFVRIHQSHLVNITYIDKYVKGIGGHIVLKDGTELPVAARKKEHLMRVLEKL
jgi:two-component system LytT family response regulator